MVTPTKGLLSIATIAALGALAACGTSSTTTSSGSTASGIAGCKGTITVATDLPLTGGAAQMALTVRTQFGAGRSSGSQHSQSLEALLAHIPGLSVVMPSTPADTYGLLRAAIQDPNPVVFIVNRLLYGMKGPQPPPDYLVPIGCSAVVRPGSDVTVVSVEAGGETLRMVLPESAAAGLRPDQQASVILDQSKFHIFRSSSWPAIWSISARSAH